jgi:hypothetical protein
VVGTFKKKTLQKERIKAFQEAKKNNKEEKNEHVL